MLNKFIFEVLRLMFSLQRMIMYDLVFVFIVIYTGKPGRIQSNY